MDFTEWIASTMVLGSLVCGLGSLVFDLVVDLVARCRRPVLVDWEREGWA